MINYYSNRAHPNLYLTKSSPTYGLWVEPTNLQIKIHGFKNNPHEFSRDSRQPLNQIVRF